MTSKKRQTLDFRGGKTIEHYKSLVKNHHLVKLAETKEELRRWQIAAAMQRLEDEDRAKYRQLLDQQETVIKKVQSMMPDVDILTLGEDE
jgi:Mg/Co/Ni transporter MgtE